MSDVMVHLSSKVYYGMLDDAKKQGAVEFAERLRRRINVLELKGKTIMRSGEFIEQIKEELMVGEQK